MIYFPVPDAEHRYELWNKVFAGPLRVAPSVDLAAVAEKYELSGGEIVNVLQSVAIKAAENGQREVHMKAILNGIRKEYQKNGRVL